MVRAASSRTEGRAPRSAPEVVEKWCDLFELLPGYDPIGTAPAGAWFDAVAADRVVAFFHECLTHVEGDLAGKPFILEPWQQALLGCMFGWKKKDRRGREVRRYRQVLLAVPRKNGKTPMVAGICLYVLACDNEVGAQIYGAAGEREQATLLYRHASGMVRNEDELANRFKVYAGIGQRSIDYPDQQSSYRVLSADADTKHGFNPHLGIIDELHVQKTRDLVDVMRTGMASVNRKQPMLVYVTTSDFDRPSICNEVWDYGRKVRDGLVDDPTFLPVIYEASIDDDWKDPELWARVNPNLGVSVSIEYLEEACAQAGENPSFENTFKRLHCNIRTQSDVVGIPLEVWDRNDSEVVEEALLGRRCFGGLDLANRGDLAAWVMVFPPTDEDPLWRILPRFFCPEDGARERERRDRAPYLAWARQGFLTLTPGVVIDYGRIRAQVLEDGERFNIVDIGADRWNLESMRQELALEGVELVEFGQGYHSMSEPTKELLDRLLPAGMMAHGENPVLRWMASHVVIEEDAAGNKKLSKKKSREKIDGLVALVMSIGRALVDDGDDGLVTYERGAMFL